ncbi:MAG TPA: hypothetical protein DCP53_01045 [Elusimicrobia bacterium]|nr:MAG: hypothetical protein A2551_00265 [Elusimicrobia bacterium RIFOXYD2_FULL_34_30]HAM37976.1 hypothetical protein [Elusimicrobiota bacterium]
MENRKLKNVEFFIEYIKKIINKYGFEIIISILVSFLFWSPLFKYPFRYLYGDFDLAITYLLAGKISFLYFKELPLFSSYIGGGFPLWAHPQNMFVSVPQFFSLLINNQWLAIRVSLVVLSIISMLGMFSLLRQLEINNFICRLFGAIVYTFSGYLISHLSIGHLTFHNLVYIPWLASAFLWSYKNDKFSYTIPILFAIMVYAGLNVTAIFIIMIALSFLTFCKIKKFVLYIIFGILLSSPKFMLSYQLLSWFPRNLTMGYVSERWIGTIHTFMTSLIWPNQSWINSPYKYMHTVKVHDINCYFGVIVLVLAIISIFNIKEHKFPKFSLSMYIIMAITLFIYPGKLNPFWSVLSKNLILGSLHMPSWFIGLLMLPIAYFSTLGLYNIKNIFKTNVNLILIGICLFVFLDYFRINKPNLDYIQTFFPFNNKAYFNKNNYFEHSKGPDWNLFKDNTYFESDLMSTYIQNNKGILQFYDSILGYDEFGFLRHSLVKSGPIDLYNKNSNVKIEWISPSKIFVEVFNTKRSNLEIPININYFPGWQISKKTRGVTLNKTWLPKKWGLLTVYLDENFPVGTKQKIILNYLPKINSYSELAIEGKQNKTIPVTAKDWVKRGMELYNSYDFNNANIAFDNAIKINSNYIPAWEEKGWTMSKVKNTGETVICFDRASVLQKKYGEFKNINTTNKDAKDYFIKAASFFVENKFKEAITDYNKAIKLDNNYIKAYYYRAESYKSTKNFTNAIADINTIISFNSGNAVAYYARGNVYKSSRDYNNAIYDYNKCIKINPMFSNAYNHLGIVYCEQKEYKKAIKAYKKAIKINPNFAEAYYNLGLTYYYYKEYKKAIKEYFRAIKSNPGYSEAYNNLGIAFYILKEYGKAIQVYTKAIELKPRYAEAYNNLGIVYFSKKEYNKAIKEYNKALEIDPGYKQAWDNLNMLYQYQKIK